MHAPLLADGRLPEHQVSAPVVLPLPSLLVILGGIRLN
jgi:hypothetical protein